MIAVGAVFAAFFVGVAYGSWRRARADVARRALPPNVIELPIAQQRRRR